MSEEYESFEDEMELILPSAELLMEEYLEVPGHVYNEKVRTLLDKQKNLFFELNSFDLDSTEQNAPKIAAIAINLIDRLEIADPRLFENYLGLLNTAGEAYFNFIEPATFGDINLIDNKVLRPSWLSPVLNEKTELLKTHIETVEAENLAHFEGYKYFISVKNGQPMIVHDEDMFEMQRDYWHNKIEEEKKEMFKVLSEREAPNDYYA